MEEEIKALKEKIAELEAKIGNSDNSEEFPKDGDEYWYMDDLGDIANYCYYNDVPGCIRRKRIGNCFKTMRDAEQAVEKLEAWKQLKDAGFEFTCCNYNIYDTDSDNEGEAYFKCKTYDGFGKDLQLLFGGDNE